MNINNEMLVNLINQLDDEIEDNPFNYDTHTRTQHILIKELARRSIEEQKIRLNIAQLKDVFYKTKQTIEERAATYEEIQRLSRLLNEM